MTCAVKVTGKGLFIDSTHSTIKTGIAGQRIAIDTPEVQPSPRRNAKEKRDLKKNSERYETA